MQMTIFELSIVALIGAGWSVIILVVTTGIIEFALGLLGLRNNFPATKEAVRLPGRSASNTLPVAVPLPDTIGL